MKARPRIGLIHATRLSMAPCAAAFAAVWPEAALANLLDDSLSADLARDGSLTPAMHARFVSLARYAHGAGADAILFTCSAFGAAIEEAAKSVPIPVSKPNEAAFAEALAAGTRLGLVVTFDPGAPALAAELRALARKSGRSLDLRVAVAEGAMEALAAGDAEEHDRRIAEAAATLTDRDTVVLGQFSMARARAAAQKAAGRPVLTTPEAAVLRLRKTLQG